VTGSGYATGRNLADAMMRQGEVAAELAATTGQCRGKHDMAMTKVMTADELAQFPADERYELIRGVLHPMTPVGRPHGRVLFRIGGPLTEHVDEHGLGTVYGGDIGIVLEHDPDTVLAPDIAFVRGPALPVAQEEQGFLSIIPHLVFEIVSPWDRMSEVRDKVARYLAAGVEQVWVVEPRRRGVIVFSRDGSERLLTEGDVLDGGEVVPGFRLAVADIFR